MPITTFTIASGANDGQINIYAPAMFSPITAGTVLNGKNYQSIYNPSATPLVNYTGWVRFPNINIAQGTTITSATLKLYGVDLGNGTAATYRSIKINIDSRNNPPNPTLWSQVFNASNNVPRGNQIASHSQFTNGSWGGTKVNYQLKDFDCTTQVQALVNSFPYSNDAMAFYIFDDNHNKSAFAYVYQKDWDTGGGKTPALQISYTLPPTLADKTTYQFV